MATKNKIIIFMLLIISTLASITVYSVDSNQTLEAYNNAKETIIGMQQEGLPTMQLIDLLSDAENYFNNADYNKSLTSSNSIIEKSVEIKELRDNLLTLTNSTKTLSDYGYDSTQTDILLIYAKSDFEASNIDLAKKSADEISQEILKVSKNYSINFKTGIDEYKTELENGEYPKRWFLQYYNDISYLYNRRDYPRFLGMFNDFETIKNIIFEKKDFIENKLELELIGVSFKRANDSSSLMQTQLEKKEYKKALTTISEINMLAKTALQLKKEIKSLTEEYNRLEDLEILDKNTRELYNTTLNEFSLENFEDSKQSLEETRKALREIETRNIILGGINKATLKKGAKDFFINSWPYLLALTLLMIISYNPVKNYSFLKYSKSSLFGAKNEKDVISTLQKELQEQYYTKKSIDKDTYNLDFEEYEERNIELENKITMLEGKIQEYEDYLKNLKNNILHLYSYIKKRKEHDNEQIVK